jgi:hypothetical protein
MITLIKNISYDQGELNVKESGLVPALGKSVASKRSARQPETKTKPHSLVLSKIRIGLNCKKNGAIYIICKAFVIDDTWQRLNFIGGKRIYRPRA